MSSPVIIEAPAMIKGEDLIYTYDWINHLDGATIGGVGNISSLTNSHLRVHDISHAGTVTTFFVEALSVGRDAVRLFAVDSSLEKHGAELQIAVVD